MVFFDATATSDSAVPRSVAQDVTFTWNFGDSGASGTGTWAYGSNPGHNSMNTAAGIVAAHLYRTAGGDTKYTATVTATDGMNTASCSLPTVTAYDPNGPNGFPGDATTCVSSSRLPVAGSGGCPAEANVLQTASIQTALSRAYGRGKRLLFKCGDTFTSDTTTDNLTAVRWALDAYGGCQNTQTNLPIFENGGVHYIFVFGGKNGEGALSNFACHGNNSSTGGCIWADTAGVMYQDTIYNGFSTGESASFNWAQCSQCAIVQSYMNGMGPGPRTEGSYFNFSGYAGYPYSGNAFNNVNYTAVIGNHFNGGLTYRSTNSETVRMSECAYCYIADNDMLNAGPSYSVLKIHEQNPYKSESTWVGQYTQYMEISDNLFGGTSGTVCTEVAPQNAQDDERLRYIVIERNVYGPVGASTDPCGWFGSQQLISGRYITARDNAFYLPNNGSYGVAVSQLGIEPAPTEVEVYNNSVTASSGADLIRNGAIGILISSSYKSRVTDPTNSFAENNLCYFPNHSSVPCVSASGSENTVSNNTSIVTDNPSWTDASGTFQKLTDWRPTANYSGGTTVPVYYDALGTPWSPTWNLGAVHH
jgi:hypothetical protein